MPRTCPVCGGKYSCPQHYVFPSIVKAREALKNGTAEVKPRIPIKKVSDKQAKINAAYKILRVAFLKAKPYCEANLEGCSKVATDVHHPFGRLGGNMLDQTTYKALCRSCHKIVETQPAMAAKIGMSGSRLSNQ